MRILYANAKVQKYFKNYSLMQRKLPFQWVRSIKKHILHLESSENFEEFLNLGLGRPEILKGYKKPHYSLRVASNVRLIIELDANKETVLMCKDVKVEGVCDYHGHKENWYIS